MFNFNGKTASLIARRPLVSVTAVKRDDFRDVGKWPFNRLFSVAWLAAVQISWNKKKFLHEKTQKSLTSPGLFRVHNMAAVSLFYTPIWLPWRHVKTIFRGWLLNTGSLNTGLTVVVFNMDRCVLAFKKTNRVYSFYPCHLSALKTSNLPTRLPGQQFEY